MRPIRTENSNFTYTGPEPAIADLPCRRESIGLVFAGISALSLAK